MSCHLNTQFYLCTYLPIWELHVAFYISGGCFAKSTYEALKLETRECVSHFPESADKRETECTYLKAFIYFIVTYIITFIYSSD